MIEECPECGQDLDSPVSMTDKHEACPKCGLVVPIPESQRQAREQSRMLSKGKTLECNFCGARFRAIKPSFAPGKKLPAIPRYNREMFTDLRQTRCPLCRKVTVYPYTAIGYTLVGLVLLWSLANLGNLSDNIGPGIIVGPWMLYRLQRSLRAPLNHD